MDNNGAGYFTGTKTRAGVGDDVVVIHSARTETNCVTLKRETARWRDVRFGGLCDKLSLFLKE